MGLPRLILPDPAAPTENAVLELGTEQARHLAALRRAVGDPLEILFPSGPWKAEIVGVGKRRASVRLVGPIGECREAPIGIHACLPITADLRLWDTFLPSAIELGATRIQPVVFERSQYDGRGAEARAGRWRRIIMAACEQSHRSKVPGLESPIPAASLRDYAVPQRWAAYEVKLNDPNPTLALEDMAFTHGPEGGITDAEIEMLRESGWKPVSLGRAVLRAATCPAAMLGAVQMELGRLCVPPGLPDGVGGGAGCAVDV
jgi:16S rRNA (uracil1498-N3)-methyltransferase